MGAQEIAVWAAEDAPRLVLEVYKKAGIAPPVKQPTFFSHRGRGPWLCMRQGLDVFKNSYLTLAQDSLFKSILLLLKAGDTLEIDFRYSMDEENPYGDCGYHRWVIHIAEENL